MSNKEENTELMFYRIRMYQYVLFKGDHFLLVLIFRCIPLSSPQKNFIMRVNKSVDKVNRCCYNMNVVRFDYS